MTKNHILIRSVALGVLLSLSPLMANAGNVDQLLVIYFNKLYPPGALQTCKIDEPTKTSFFAGFEQKNCMDRRTIEGQQFIYGFKAPCADAEAKANLDLQVNSFCSKQIQQAKDDKLQAQLMQLAANKQQPQSGSGGAASSNSGGSSGAGGLKGAIDTGKQALDTYDKLDRYSDKAKEAYEKRGEYKEKVSEGWSKTKSAVGLGDKDSKAPQANKPATVAGQTAGNATAQALAPTTRELEIQADKEKLEGMAKNYQAACTGPNKAQNCAELSKGLDAASDEVQAKIQMQADEEKAKITEQIAKQKKEEAAQLATASPSQQAAASATITGPEAQNAAITPDSTTGQANQAAEGAAKKEEGQGQSALAKPKATAAAAPTNCEAELAEVEAAQKSFSMKKTICVKAANTAENFCDKLRSPAYQQVQQWMSIGGTILSKVTAASEACGTTATISKVAQGGILGAQLMCTTVKLTCDKGCAAATAALAKFKAANAKLKTCASAKVQASAQAKGAEGNSLLPNPTTNAEGQVLVTEANHEQTHAVDVNTASQQFDQMITEEEKPATVADKIGEDGKPAGKEVTGGSERDNATQRCAQKASADIKLMGLAALGMLSSFLDAKQCQKQLAAGGSDNGNGTSSSSMVTPTMTTAEYCAVPGNATSITCKCTANPNADGCMGSIAGSGVGLGKINSGTGASAFASAKQNGLGALDPLGKSTTGVSDVEPGAGLSEGARAALGIGGSAESSGSLGGGGGQGLASNPEKGKAVKEEKEKSKFGFFSSIGSMFSGGKSANTAAKAAIRGYEQDQAIKRKLASDQVRAEITTASGKSNFDKIKSAYKSNLNSFEQ